MILVQLGERKMLDEPLEVDEARKLVREILKDGTVRFTSHARKEMENDNISEAELRRALYGVCEPAEWEHGQWRYRFHSYSVWAVVLFRDEEMVVIITAWRKTR